MKPSLKQSLIKFLREWVKPILVVVIVVGAIRSTIADWNDVPTGSMKPTILEGDRIFVNKLAYGLRVPFTRWNLIEWDGPMRGDVIVLFAPDSGTRLVKRVCGVPGDRLELRNNLLFVNGELASYARLDPEIVDQISPDEQRRHLFASERIDGAEHPIMITPRAPAKRSFPPMTVPDDHYFVMGDNRDESRDSRWFGFVPRNLITGRATNVAISFDPDRYYLPRCDRFFRSLP
jgi:signal peptidase I